MPDSIRDRELIDVLKEQEAVLQVVVAPGIHRVLAGERQPLSMKAFFLVEALVVNKPDTAERLHELYGLCGCWVDAISVCCECHYDLRPCVWIYALITSAVTPPVVSRQ